MKELKGLEITQRVYTFTHLAQEIDFMVNFHITYAADAGVPVESVTKVRNNFLDRVELALNNQPVAEMINYKFRDVVIQIRRMCFAMWEAMASKDFDFPISKIYAEVIDTLRVPCK